MGRAAQPRPHQQEQSAAGARMMGAAVEPVAAPVRLAAAPMMTATEVEPNPLIVSVAEVARRMGLDPAALTTLQTDSITDAIMDAQADVAGKLNRPLVPTVETLTGQWPTPGYDPDRPQAWQHLESRYDDIVKVLTATYGSPDSGYTLQVQIGLDGRAEQAITRYVRAHAIELLRLNPATTIGERAVTSVSAEGQSISYEQRSQQAGVAGALPTFDTIKQFKRLSVFQRRTRPREPWPYSR